MEAQFEALSELVKNGQKLNFGQDFFVKFYQAFLYSDRWQQYIKGVGTTLLVTAIALVLGVVLGAIVAMVRVGYAQQKPHHRNPILGIFNAAAQVYVTVIRGTPMMVQLLIMSMVIFASSRNFTMVGALALGINSGAYVSEIIRGGLMAVDPGQMEAGRSLGLNYMTTMFEIIIPQAIRSILPSLGNEFIMLLKDSSLITVIGGKELLYAAQGIMNRTYEPMFPLLGVAATYLVLVFFVKFYQAFLYSDRWQQYIKGVGTTLLVTAIALVLGVVLGAIVAMVRVGYAQQKPHHRNPILGIFNAAAQVYVTVIRGTPMMVQLLIMSMVIFASSRNFTMVGALALGINSGAYVSEIIRGGLMAVDPGQMEAGRSLGLNYMTTMFEIIIPQAIRSILPSLGNEFIMLLKDSSLITVIGGKELLYAAQGIMNRTYEPMFPLLGVAATYLVLVMLFSALLAKFERRLAQSDRR